MRRFASIDLGTNTCNLLIADYEGRSLKTVCVEKRAVMLLKNSGSSNTIQPDAITRCRTVVAEYKQLVSLYKADITIANATSGIRSASNGNQILGMLHTHSGVEFGILSGDQEAALIHKGVANALNGLPGKLLLLDIGGGSNEFVIFEGQKILWKKSFNLGISRLLNKFQLRDPLCLNDMKPVYDYFDAELTELYEQLKIHHVEALVGSSGTFETISNIIRCKTGGEISSENSFPISAEDFHQVFQIMTTCNVNERLAIEGMEALRVELMPLASAFVNHLLNRTRITHIIHSRYSIKEGAIFNFIENHNL
ncbi:MAG TPA: hypothetical protein PLZ52_09650 [Bacteroidales bacterium]|nr:hypothetical protein [Bacteroidales bacterium]HOE05471.1 hypothetical protein [Bacteroidales bacterium]